MEQTELRDNEITIRLLAPSEMSRILPLVEQLNPSIPPPVLAERLTAMLQQGYQCAAALVDDQCIGIAGLWLGTRFYCGRYIDIDNVIVDEQYRKRGIGQQLMDWVHRYAADNGCHVAVLDAYVTNARAHKFYFRNGYHIIGFHFTKPLE